MGRRVYRAKNRGRNEGTIAYRPCDGRWCARLDLGVINGKRVRKCFYGDTRKEVDDKLTLAKGQLLKGEAIPVGRFTVAQLLEEWLTIIAPPVVAARTHESYSLNSRKHIIPAIGKIQVSKLEPMVIQMFLNEKTRSGLSAQTVRHIRTVLRRALNFAIQMKKVSFNNATLVTLPKVDREEIRPLSEEQVRCSVQLSYGRAGNE